jgi:SAM-dependent methyltransferase
VATTALQRLQDAVGEGVASAANAPGRPEAVLREAVEPALEDALRERGARARRRAEVHLSVPAEAAASALDAPLSTRGRADAIFNRFVIEFEPPGALRPSLIHSGTTHAVAQVQQYLRGVAAETGLGLSRLAGCAFDGTWLVYVFGDGEEWQVQRPRRVDLDSLQSLVDALESLAAGRGLTADNLEEDFGRASDTASEVVASLGAVLTTDPNSRTTALFSQWQLDIGNASGFGPDSDLPEWVDLCEALGVPADGEVATEILFALQTYFALVARLFAIVVLEGATGAPLINRLRAGATLWDGFAELESGALTVGTRATNLIEPGVFSWYVEEQSPQLLAALDTLVARVEEYSAEVVEITPTAARDVFKDLYQRLVPRAIRHRLGEFYTPDWLARHVVDLVDEPTAPLTHETRVLDPACGSGTFIVEALARILQRADDANATAVLANVTKNVVGFDLSPLAVQAAKVNYLLAIAPLLRRAEADVLLPIFLADSVSPPRHGGLFEGDVLTLRSAEGEWRVPTAIATEEGLFAAGRAFQSSLHANADPDRVVEAIRSELPALPDSTEVDEAVGDLYRKLSELHRAGRDGIWWNLITNALAPVVEGRFDVVVGNPPWVSWETLPEDYRRLNEDQWDLYALRPERLDGRRQGSGNVRLDLSMLFVARCVDRYLRDGGRLAFVITASVFRSELAGRGFRRRILPPNSTYTFVRIDDLSRLSVFEDASNRTGILLAARTPAPSVSQVPVTMWEPQGSATIRPSASLEDVLASVRRVELAGEPVDPSDAASPQMVMPAAALSASRPLRRASPYLQTVREGINTRGANGILFVDILEDREDGLRIRNDPTRGRLRDLTIHEAVVERGAVRRLLRGEDVAPGVASPSGGVLFFHDAAHLSQPLQPTEAARRWPNAVAFATEFEPFLRARRTFRNFDPSGDGWLGLYSVTTAAIAEHKVVIREIATSMIAAPIHDAQTVPDHKLHVIPCGSGEEADRLAAILNSEIVRALVASFSLSTSLTGSFLRYVGIRPTDAGATATSDEALAASLGLSLEELRAFRSSLS